MRSSAGGQRLIHLFSQLFSAASICTAAKEMRCRWMRQGCGHLFSAATTHTLAPCPAHCAALCRLGLPGRLPRPLCGRSTAALRSLRFLCSSDRLTHNLPQSEVIRAVMLRVSPYKLHGLTSCPPRPQRPPGGVHPGLRRGRELGGPAARGDGALDARAGARSAGGALSLLPPTHRDTDGHTDTNTQTHRHLDT